METKVVNQLHLIFEGEEIKTFLDVARKVSLQRPQIGLFKAKTSFVTSEIELMSQISERFPLPKNEKHE